MKAVEMVDTYICTVDFHLDILFEIDLLNETRNIIRNNRCQGHSAIMGACETQADKWRAFIAGLDKKGIKHNIKPVSAITILRSL